MATNDVPGYKPENRDVLGMGAWAEAEDGSLIFVEGVEAARVVYAMFDLAATPPVQFRDAMNEWDFKKAYSWEPDADPEEALPADAPKRSKKAKKDAVALIQTAKVCWTWHDKTPFPWDRVMKGGAKPGLEYASAEGQLNAARRVAEALGLQAEAIQQRLMDDPEGSDRKTRKMLKLAKRLGKMLDTLPAVAG